MLIRLYPLTLRDVIKEHWHKATVPLVLMLCQFTMVYFVVKVDAVIIKKFINRTRNGNLA